MNNNVFFKKKHRILFLQYLTYSIPASVVEPAVTYSFLSLFLPSAPSLIRPHHYLHQLKNCQSSIPSPGYLTNFPGGERSIVEGGRGGGGGG